MITFAAEMGLWSKFIFWFTAINIVLTLVFTLVIIIGGLFDLKFLFKALKEEEVDEQDDGRVLS